VICNCVCEKYLQSELERRRESFIPFISDLKENMNRLDDKINLRYNVKTFKYQAKKFIICIKHNETIDEDLNFLKSYYPDVVFDHSISYGTDIACFYCIGEQEVSSYQYEINFDRPKFQIGDYEFIGYVTPKSNKCNTNVNLVYPYSDNRELYNNLLETSNKRKCDYCNREMNRSMYFIFMDKNKSIFYYGRNCAEKIFGISIVEKIDRFVKCLDLNRKSDISLCEKGNTTTYELLGFISAMCQFNALYSKGKIIEDTINFAYDVMGILSTRNKLIQDGQVQYSNDKCFHKYIIKDNKEYGVIFNEYLNVHEQSETLLELFYKNAGDFFRKQYVSGDNQFKDAVRSYGIAMVEGIDRQYTKGCKGIMPYMLRDFFGSIKPQNNVVLNYNTHQIEPFSGFKNFSVKIIKCEQLVAKNGNSYFKYYACTDKLEGLFWIDFKSEEPMVINTEIQINGVVSKYNPKSGNFTLLDQVTITENVF
jgi:hypothetical protein